MRVLFVQQQPCIRTLKYAEGLRAIRPRTRLAFACRGRTLSQWYGAGDELFERWWSLGPAPRDVLRQVVDEFRPDLIHSHNLPDSLTVLALEVAGGRIPVVHDVHDLQSLRQTPYEDGFPEPGNPLALERRAIEGSAALVTVSEELLAAIAARHRLPPLTTVFPNYVLGRHLPQELPPAGGGPNGPPRVVYQGTLSTNDGHYDLRHIFGKLCREGISLDVFPSRAVPAYHDFAASQPGMRCHDTLDPHALLQTLPKYDFGWAGFNANLNAAHIDTALPNKAFEYIGCGLPVLTFEHRALARFVQEQGVGVALATPDDLAGQLAGLDVAQLRRRVAAARFDFTVERNIGRLADLYEAVVG